MVIGADLSEFRDFGLNKAPIERISPTSDDDGGTAVAGAVQMNAVTSNVNQLSERGACSIAGLSGGNGGRYAHHEKQQSGTG
jgi:hypothetical protein